MPGSVRITELEQGKLDKVLEFDTRLCVNFHEYTFALHKRNNFFQRKPGYATKTSTGLWVKVRTFPTYPG